MANCANLCPGRRARRVAATRGSAGWRRRAARPRPRLARTITVPATIWMCQKNAGRTVSAAAAVFCIHRGSEWTIPWVGGSLAGVLMTIPVRGLYLDIFSMVMPGWYFFDTLFQVGLDKLLDLLILLIAMCAIADIFSEQIGFRFSICPYSMNKLDAIDIKSTMNEWKWQEFKTKNGKHGILLLSPVDEDDTVRMH